MSRGDFWSRRKAEVAAETQVQEALQDEEIQAAREAELAEKTDEELLEELGLPDPDAMDDGDDFKAFLAEGIPARLKTRALRRLWRVNPLLANVDGLVDYGEDFTDAATVIENMQSAYQVGKGMTKHVLEMVRQAEEEANGDAPADDVAESEDGTELEVGTDHRNEDTLVVDFESDTSRSTQPEPDPEPIELEPNARRMRFAFDATAAAT